jgi:hypothetical protein
LWSGSVGSRVLGRSGGRPLLLIPAPEGAPAV